MNRVTPHGQYAGFVSRLLAFVLDVTILTALGSILLFIGSTVWDFFASNNPLPTAWQPVFYAAGAILSVLLTAGYFVFFWVVALQTPGLALLGLRLVPLDGRPLTFRRSLLRYVGYWLAALPLFAGFLWVLVDDRRQGWHDKLARTCVLYNREAHTVTRTASVQRLTNR